MSHGFEGSGPVAAPKGASRIVEQNGYEHDLPYFGLYPWDPKLDEDVPDMGPVAYPKWMPVQSTNKFGGIEAEWRYVSEDPTLDEILERLPKLGDSDLEVLEKKVKKLRKEVRDAY